jgi:hypothetical protein
MSGQLFDPPVERRTANPASSSMKLAPSGMALPHPRRRSMPNILIILSAADTWTRADGSPYESGVWAEEFVVMDEKLIGAGFDVDIATPGGVAPRSTRTA